METFYGLVVTCALELLGPVLGNSPTGHEEPGWWGLLPEGHFWAVAVGAVVLVCSCKYVSKSCFYAHQPYNHIPVPPAPPVPIWCLTDRLFPSSSSSPPTQAHIHTHFLSIAEKQKCLIPTSVRKALSCSFFFCGLSQIWSGECFWCWYLRKPWSKSTLHFILKI